jgi:hypothetical protein
MSLISTSVCPVSLLPLIQRQKGGFLPKLELVSIICVATEASIGVQGDGMKYLGIVRNKVIVSQVAQLVSAFVCFEYPNVLKLC